MEKKNRQIYILKFIRVFSALIVFLSHYGTPLYNDSINVAGEFGVAFFFMISGFLLIYNGKIKEYFINRIIRICPLYYLTSGLIYLISKMNPELLRTTVVTPITFLKSLFFLPFYVETPTGVGIWPIYMVGWTLNIEIFVYIIFYICLRIFKENRKSGCACIFFLCILYGIGCKLEKNGNIFIDTYCQIYILWFAVGMICACIFLSKNYKGKIANQFALCWSRLNVAIQSTLMIIITMVNVALACFYQNNILFLTLCSMTFVFYIFVMGRIKSIPSFFEIIGDMSYSIYLIHYFVVCVFLRIWKVNFETSNIFLQTLMLICCFAIVLFTSFISYQLIECKLSRFLKRIYMKVRTYHRNNN